MLKEIAKPKAGQLKEGHGPCFVGEVIVDNLANSSEQPFSTFREQITAGRLPNLAQHPATVAAKKRKEMLS